VLVRGNGGGPKEERTSPEHQYQHAGKSADDQHQPFSSLKRQHPPVVPAVFAEKVQNIRYHCGSYLCEDEPDRSKQAL
jgi:hypothetical protein